MVTGATKPGRAFDPRAHGCCRWVVTESGVGQEQRPEPLGVGRSATGTAPVPSEVDPAAGESTTRSSGSRPGPSAGRNVHVFSSFTA